MSAPLLQIRNHHTLACGDPPLVDGNADKTYVGYFENSFGEQWVFTRDRSSGVAILRGGDVGWNEQFDVTNGHADLVLNPEERLWLQACLSASRHRGVDA